MYCRRQEQRFVPESTFDSFESTRYLERHGKPVAFYSDKLSVFCVNAKDPKAGDDFPQFERALSESSLGSTTVEECVARAVARWQFPQPDGGGYVVVSYPFLLEQSGQ